MLRYTSAALGLALLVLIVEGRKAFRIPKPWLQLGRGVGVSVATICFFLGVMAMPLADATAIQFTSPIITAMLAPLFLNERTTRDGVAAMALAFAGVLVVLRPNVLALGATAFYPVGAARRHGLPDDLQPQGGGRGVASGHAILRGVMAAPILIAATLLLAATGAQQFQIGVPPASVVIKSLIVACTATFAHMLIYMATVRASAARRADDLCAAAGRGGAEPGDLRDGPGLLDLCRRGPDHRRRAAALAGAEAEGGAGTGMIISRTAFRAQKWRPERREHEPGDIGHDGAAGVGGADAGRTQPA